jgi:hypothetical protein
MSLSALSAYYGSDEDSSSDAEDRGTLPGNAETAPSTIAPVLSNGDVTNATNGAAKSVNNRSAILSKLDARLLERKRLVQRSTGPGEDHVRSAADKGLDESDMEGWRALAKMDFRPVSLISPPRGASSNYIDGF